MNLLQTFIAEATEQSRPVNKRAFTIVGESPAVSRVGAFGQQSIVPVMTRQGYQDHQVLFARVEASLFSTPPQPHIELVLTDSGKTLFVQAIDNSDPVLYTFMLTEREP